MVNAINNLKTGTRLIAAFLIVAALVALVAVFGYSNMHTIMGRMDDMYQNRMLPTQQLGAAKTDLYTMRGDVYKYVLLPQERDSAEKAIAADIADLEKQMAAYRATKLDPREVELLAQFDQQWPAYKQAASQAMADAKAGKDDVALASLLDGGAVSNARKALGPTFDQLTAYQEQVAEALIAESAAAFASSTRVMAGVAVAGVLLAVALGILISRSVTAPLATLLGAIELMSRGDLLRDMSEAAKDKVRVRKDEMGDFGRAFDRLLGYLQRIGEVSERIAQGDLTVSVSVESAKDEIGNALVRMVESLRQAVYQIRAGADSVTSAAAQSAEAAGQTGTAVNQVAQTIEQVAKGANQTAQSVVEANQGMEELARAIDGIAKGAQEAAGAVGVMSASVNLVGEQAISVGKGAAVAAKEVESGNTVAEEGVHAVRDTLSGMQVIQQVIKQATSKVEEMGQRSQEVSRIVATIEDIAGQTNLLALNAQIEAARAGEQGRGFAVVADEVRKLAERSARATQEIAELVGAVQKGAQEAVDAIGRGQKEVEGGVELAGKAGDVIERLRKAMEQIAAQVGQVSQAGSKLEEASQRMVAEVEKVSAVVEEVSASSEEMSASSSSGSASGEFGSFDLGGSGCICRGSERFHGRGVGAGRRARRYGPAGGRTGTGYAGGGELLQAGAGERRGQSRVRSAAAAAGDPGRCQGQGRPAHGGAPAGPGRRCRQRPSLEATQARWGDRLHRAPLAGTAHPSLLG
jgi:methyl-accepting chemotaxis protein